MPEYLVCCSEVNLAQIVPSLEARHGGPSRSVLNLSHALAASGESVELLATQPGPGSTLRPAPNLAIHHFSREAPQRFSISGPLRQHLEASHYDLIHSHSLWLRPLHYAARAAQRTRVPLVISPRGMMTPWAWSHNRWKKNLASFFIHPGAFKQAAGWHATSEAEAEDIRRLGFNQPVCVAPNGVIIPDTGSVASARAHWLALYPQLGQRRVALFYSRFHEKKRIIELLELWISQAPRDWLLLVVGIPETYTVSFLTTYVARAGGASRVIVADGTTGPAPYAVASLYLLPSHSENFGLTIAEALAHGLPAIATDTTPWQGLGSHHAGRCVPWDEFGDALAQLTAESPSSLEARGVSACAWMQADYSWARSAAILSAFYRQLAPC